MKRLYAAAALAAALPFAVFAAVPAKPASSTLARPDFTAQQAPPPHHAPKGEWAS